MPKNLMVHMHKHYELLINGKWELDEAEETENKYISSEEYDRITCYETKCFFEKYLGGKEVVNRKKGGFIHRLVSYSPDRQQRVVYHFDIPTDKSLSKDKE